jgi:histidinol phosphatase-like PHP family hydrolase
MLISSDWHIHSAASYDSVLTLDTIAERAKEWGFSHVGITDHVNTNEPNYLRDGYNSAVSVKEAQKKYPFAVLGVELTPIDIYEYEYIRKNGTRAGFSWPTAATPLPIELPMTKEEMLALGMRYAVGATHWRIDQPGAKEFAPELEGCIREWYRQQLWLAQDARVTVLGHPWCISRGTWYQDFSVIPRSANMEIAAALKENGKYVECNAHFFVAGTSEKFRHQYAEYMREMFEMGISVIYGSDAHNTYTDNFRRTEPYLAAAGFCDGDIGGIAEKDLPRIFDRFCHLYGHPWLYSTHINADFTFCKIGEHL